MSCQIRKMKIMAAAGCQERPTNPESVKIFQNDLAKLQAERVRQDAMWEMPVKGGGDANTSNHNANKVIYYNTSNFLVSNQGPS